jgi:antagonist of KipI
MSISIIKPGLMDTIQDGGRWGFGNWGVNPGGVMDPYAAALANILVGNGAGTPVLEMHFPGPQVLFEQNALICITGADFGTTIDDEPVSLWQPFVVRKNSVLQFPEHIRGARAYLAIHGGFVADRWLGSAATNLKAGRGGFKGRKLEKGDELMFGESSMYFAGFLQEKNIFRKLPWRADPAQTYFHGHEICFIPGPEWQMLTNESREDLQRNNFIIHPSSDRMGYRIKSSSLQTTMDSELLSAPVSFGTMQLLPGGQLVILMADHQTTGGYPRIGNIVSAHFPKLAQLRPSDGIQFKLTDLHSAGELLFEQKNEIDLIRYASEIRMNESLRL